MPAHSKPTDGRTRSMGNDPLLSRRQTTPSPAPGAQTVRTKRGIRLSRTPLWGIYVLRDVFEQLAPQPWHSPQLGQGFGFDLADSLAADAELFANLAERSLVAAIQAEP
jgi:hypothetical protein